MKRKASFPKILILATFSWVLLSLTQYLQAQEIKFEHLTTDNGLSSNSVRCLFQDKQGYIWIGTEDGLNKYDGISFTNYKTIQDDTNSLSDNFINQIYEDKKGNLWIATNFGGVNLFDRKTEKFKRFKHNPNDTTSLLNNSITSIYEDQESKLIFLSLDLGLNYYQTQTNSFERVRISTDTVSNMNTKSLLYADKQNNLWIAGAVGLLQYNSKTKKVKKIKANKPEMLTLILPESDDVFLVTLGNNLYRFDKRTETYTEVDKKITAYTSKYQILSLYQDSQFIWLGTYNGGLIKYHKKKSEITTYFHEKTNSLSISSNIVNAIFEDNARSIWVGCYLGGINKFEKHKKFETHLNEQIITAFCEYQGVEWIATQTTGLHRYDVINESWTNFKYNPENPHTFNITASINAVFQDHKGRLWLGTWQEGLYLMEQNADKSSQLKFEHLLPNESILVILEDSKNRIWIGANGTLFLYKPENKSFLRFFNDPQNPKSIGDARIQTIVEDVKTNSLWIGTWNGLYQAVLPINQEITTQNVYFKTFRYNQKDNNSISDDKIISLCLSKNGTLWAGTYAGGLNEISFNTSKSKPPTINRYLQENGGLPSNCVFGIQEDTEGVLWISTNKGFLSFNPASKIYKSFDKNDGLQGSDYYWRSSYKSQSGKMFFGGSNGYNAFFPKNIKLNNTIPPVVITRFSIFNQNITISTPNSPLKKHISETQEITINYNQSMIGFEFAALNYVSSYKNKYKYKMEGFDSEWVNVENYNKAIYTNLDPGTYIFRVKASNNDGIWNEEGTSIIIHILPPWWETWWFRTLVTSIIVGAFFSLYKIRTDFLKKQNIKLEQLVTKRTEELSVANEFLKSSKEELLQNQEEIITQKDFIESQNQNLLKQNQLVEEKNQQIRQSINAALTIQRAILPHQKKVENLLGEHFVLYNPKDVVSGDFYWLHQIDNQTILVVSDCTGHGVPGAFMTLIGNSLLNKIVRTLRILEPAEILHQLHQEVYKALKQKYTGNNYGMDAIAININKITEDTSRITFSGAKNDLYYIDAQENDEVKIIKGNRRAIGGQQNEAIKFDNNQIMLSKDSIIYLGSDGYIDQNNTKRKRLGINTFVDLIKKNYSLPIAEQKTIFENTLKEHMQDTYQRDDILLIGIKV